MGTNTLSLTFTPTDTGRKIPTATMTVPIVVKPAKATRELQSSIRGVSRHHGPRCTSQPAALIYKCLTITMVAKLPAE